MSKTKLVWAATVWGVIGLNIAVRGEQRRATTMEASVVLYVSPSGKDGFSGNLSETNGDKTDGPLATLAGARDKVRELRGAGAIENSATVYLRGGRYLLDQPVMFGPEDSGPVTYASYPGEEAIIDGGRRITGWKTQKVNDRDAWAADVPWVKSGRWYFRELFVDGKRCTRARLPKGTDLFKTAGPALEYQVTHTNMGSITRAFHCVPGEISADWKNPGDIDLVVLHFWTEERSGIASFDPATNILVMSRIPTQPMGEDTRHPDARFYVENVFEALQDPGDWYLDRPSGKIYYIPRPGEDPEKTEVVAPRVTQLIKIAGKPEDQGYVSFIHFKDLTFTNADWSQPNTSAAGLGRPDLNFASGGQAASDVPGCIQMIGARFCAIEDCRIEHVGMYGVELGEGVLSDMGGIYTLGNQTGTIIRGNVIHDVTSASYGAGGIYPDEGSAGLVIENNVVYDVGSEPLMPHYCRENIVRNNIFAFGGEGVAELGKSGDRNGYTLERNVLITNGQPVYRGGYASKLEDVPFKTDLNVIWDVGGKEPVLGKNSTDDGRTFSLEQWQGLGEDTHSVFVNPGFKDLGHRDFTLLPGSAALGVGFVPIDVSDVGPRGEGRRE